MSLEILNLGTIYPQALLAFNICITYSVIAPIILIFGTAYFGIGYLVYKYKILNGESEVKLYPDIASQD